MSLWRTDRITFSLQQSNRSTAPNQICYPRWYLPGLAGRTAQFTTTLYLGEEGPSYPCSIWWPEKGFIKCCSSLCTGCQRNHLYGKLGLLRKAFLQGLKQARLHSPSVTLLLSAGQRTGTGGLGAVVLIVQGESWPAAPISAVGCNSVTNRSVSGLSKVCKVTGKDAEGIPQPEMF